jgi:hypothetical protein
VVKNEAARPLAIAFLVTSAMSAPGVMVNSAAMAIKARKLGPIFTLLIRDDTLIEALSLKRSYRERARNVNLPENPHQTVARPSKSKLVALCHFGYNAAHPPTWLI